VEEHNANPEGPLPTQASPAASSARESVPGADAGNPPTLTAQDDHVPQAFLDEIKAQNEEQLSFQRSSHELLVDLSDRVKSIADEASSRENRSLLLELVLLHDSLEQVLRWVSDSDDPQPKDVMVDRLETLRIELLEILIRREVRIYDGTHEVLDRRLHRTIKTVPTSDSTLNDRVKTVVRTGFFWREQPLRPEEVIIFKYKPELPEEH